MGFASLPAMASHVADFSSMETVLLQGIRASEESAFHQLFTLFRERIYRTALRILKEEEAAKDALQETLINIYRAAGTFRGEAKLSTWINRITVNVCLEILRKNRKHRQRTDEDISEFSTLEDPRPESPFDLAHRSEVKAKVRGALGTLSRKHRDVLEMHDLAGYTIREISARVGVAEGTIKSRLFYGREELKRQLLN